MTTRLKPFILGTLLIFILTMAYGFYTSHQTVKQSKEKIGNAVEQVHFVYGKNNEIEDVNLKENNSEYSFAYETNREKALDKLGKYDFVVTGKSIMARNSNLFGSSMFEFKYDNISGDKVTKGNVINYIEENQKELTLHTFNKSQFLVGYVVLSIVCTIIAYLITLPVSRFLSYVTTRIRFKEKEEPNGTRQYVYMLYRMFIEDTKFTIILNLFIAFTVLFGNIYYITKATLVMFGVYFIVYEVIVLIVYAIYEEIQTNRA